MIIVLGGRSSGVHPSSYFPLRFNVQRFASCQQVRSLQEEMRLRQEAVRAAEASLTDRAASAENACREAESRRRMAEAAGVSAEENAHKAQGEVR